MHGGLSFWSRSVGMATWSLFMTSLAFLLFILTSTLWAKSWSQASVLTVITPSSLTVLIGISVTPKCTRTIRLINILIAMAVFILEEALSFQKDNALGAIFIFKTHYPTGRNWANICSSSRYESLVLRRAQDALSVWTNYPSKFVLHDALRRARNYTTGRIILPKG